MNAVAHLPSQKFQPRIYGIGAWTDNLFFAHDLIATLRPRLFVELGTDRGESYFAFCQSVAEQGTATQCFAVDTWRGDEQSGGCDETTFEEVQAHNEQHYTSFSTLLRMRFDEALERFEPGSIDLLHIDGLHTEEAVRHDVESWLPKMKPGGILLMHDITVRERDFGVWKVWQELEQQGRSFAFTDGPGLGVWEKPPPQNLSEPLASLLVPNAGSAREVIRYYQHRARELQEKIAEHWRDGSIRQTPAGRQTIVQIFYTRDGVHREEHTVAMRVGHETWKNVSLTLPPEGGAAPLRIDFLSALTCIDIARLHVYAGSEVLFSAETGTHFNRVRVAGDAQRLPHAWFLRLQITGVDPQLYLPPLVPDNPDAPVRLEMYLRVTPGAEPAR